MSEDRKLLAEYKAHYTDDRHDLDIVIKNFFVNEKRFELFFLIDDIAFVGTSFCDFELADDGMYIEASEKFCIQKFGGSLYNHDFPYIYCLQRYTLYVEIPVELINQNTHMNEKGLLQVQYNLKKHDMSVNQARFILDGQRIYMDDILCEKFQIYFCGKIYSADNPSTYFEYSLIQIIKKCRNDFMLKCCFTCQYSDYSPYGSDDFGTMLCYKNHKDVYLTVNDKNGFFDRLEGLDCDIQQETNLCDEFEERRKCEGYRGFV